MKSSLKQQTSKQQVRALPGILIDEHFQRQVEGYRAWLAEQTREHNSLVFHQMGEYAARAMQAVEVGNSRIQTFAPFRYKYSALQTITRKQVVFVVLIALIWLAGMVWDWKVTVAWTISLITIAYLSHLILDVFVALRAVRTSSEEHIDETLLAALQDAEWPPYTVLCPLYKEPQVVPQFASAMKKIDYPADKLQILFLTEEDDDETRKAILSLRLPPHFRIVTVPDGAPRTKPRACNYGLVEATGQYVVIYDAEDVPDPLQLKKAVLTFANHGPDLACVQARLNFYNPQQNLLTRWFTAEYSLWFDLILPGLQEARLAIPLGGTSNHFPTQTLRALGGWDAFNVTEDCDLGLRLSWFRLKTVIVDSTTLEEANSNVKNWIRQRSRWIKGYMQTYLVHMREPLHYLRYKKFRELFSLQVLVGGKTAILLINPLMWILLALTLVFHAQVASVFATLFPPFILYTGVITLILGNFFYGYIYLLGCMKREQYSLVKWMLLIPGYWVLASIAACMALYELFTRPHYWQKTIHGLHLKQSSEATAIDVEWEELARLAELLTPISMMADALPEHGMGIAAQVQKYEKLGQVPVASVQDSVETMIAPRKPALPPSERAYLERSKHARRDIWLAFTFLTALALSVAACVYFFGQGQTLLFPGASAQMDLARRFVIGPPRLDFAQLGNSVLPLPSLAMAPFVWNDFLWSTGLAGSIPAMLGYIVTAVYVYLIARALTRRRVISYLCTLIFLLNPTMLYLQSIPSGELIIGMAMSMMVCYYLVAWIQSGKPGHLLGAAGGLCLATLCSYDAWLFLAVIFALILLVGLVKRQRRAHIASNLLVFTILGGLGIGLWLLWNWTMFGSPISFIHTGILVKTTLPAALAPYHSGWQVVQFYELLALDTLNPALAALALLGIVAFVVQWARKPVFFVALALLAPVALHFVALYYGYMAFVLPFPVSANVQARLLNAYLGAELVPLAAIFVASLLGGWHWPSNSERAIEIGALSEPEKVEMMP